MRTAGQQVANLGYNAVSPRSQHPHTRPVAPYGERDVEPLPRMFGDAIALRTDGLNRNVDLVARLRRRPEIRVALPLADARALASVPIPLRR